MPTYNNTMKNPFIWFDTTLRDGQLDRDIRLDAEQRMDIALILQAAGISVIELAFPAMHPEDVDSSIEIAKKIESAGICCIAKMNAAHIEAAMQVLRFARQSRLHLYLEAKYNDSRYQEKVRDLIGETVSQARNRVAEVEFSLMDVSNIEVEYLTQMVSYAIDAGANIINLSDTQGIAQAYELQQRFLAIQQNLDNSQNVVLSLHAHNHQDRAVTNALALLGVVQQIEGTIGGVGPAGGNLDLLELAEKLEDRNVPSGVDLAKLNTISQVLRNKVY